MSDCGHMSCKVYAAVTWQNGTEETIRCYAATVRDGVLILSEATYSPREARCIPLTSIREYSIKEYS
jgi:hypothetical protein